MSPHRFDYRLRIFTLGALGLFALSAGATEGESHRLTVRTSDRCELGVDRIDQDGIPSSCWILSCRGRRTVKVGCDVTAFLAVADVSVSPDRKWLAVISVGEGHPMLEVVDLLRFTDAHVYEPLASINPYPGTVLLAGWEPQALRVESDVPLDRLPLPIEEVDSWLLPEPRLFRLEIPTWMVVPAASAP